MKPLPAGIRRFADLAEGSMYFADNTRFISLLDEGDDSYVYFVRPEGFGKTLFVSMLEAYYDLASSDRFDRWFHDTWIHDHVTADQGRYQVLRLDLSGVSGDPRELESSFEQVACSQITRLAEKYASFYDPDFLPVMADFSRAALKLNHFCVQARLKGYMLYLLVDDYDSIARAVLSAAGSSAPGAWNASDATLFYRDFFRMVKTGFSRIFMTGTFPLTMDDLTSGFNIATNLTTDPRYNAMLGFSLEDLRQLLSRCRSQNLQGDLDPGEIAAALASWCGGYCFSGRAFLQKETVLNSRMVLECLAKILETGQIPGELAVAPDPGAAAVLKLSAGGRGRSGNEAGRAEHLLSALDGSGAGNTVMPQMVAGIPAEQLAEDGHFISRCFSLGALTVTGTDLGRPVLVIPNQNVRCQLRELLGLGKKAA